MKWKKYKQLNSSQKEEYNFRFHKTQDGCADTIMFSVMIVGFCLLAKLWVCLGAALFATIIVNMALFKNILDEREWIKNIQDKEDRTSITQRIVKPIR